MTIQEKLDAINKKFKTEMVEASETRFVGNIYEENKHTHNITLNNANEIYIEPLDEYGEPDGTCVFYKFNESGNIVATEE